MIKSITIGDLSCLSVNRQEVLRYLGVKNADETTNGLITLCHREAMDVVVPSAVYVESDVTAENGVVEFDFMRVNSTNLATNLSGCKKAYLFCATLGIGVDRMIERLNRTSPAKAVVFSAVCSSLVESLCDYVNEKIIGQDASRPRFSCGYGDFCLEHQRDILSALEADKRLGVYLTDSYMMVPVKTVTAVIGIRR